MKKVPFTFILIFALCFVVSAQEIINSCQKIVITSPTNVSLGESFNAAAYFEKGHSPSAKFDWMIIKGNKITKKNKTETIEISSEDLEDSNQIILLVSSTESTCENTAMAKVSIVPACGLPYTIDQYRKLPWEDEKARLKNVLSMMENFEDLELFAFFEFDKKTPPNLRKNHLAKVLNYLSVSGNFDKNRITFSISESDSERIYFQPLPDNFSPLDADFIIKGEYFNKLNNLFQPKPVNKNGSKVKL